MTEAQLEQIEESLDKWEANQQQTTGAALDATDVCHDSTLLPFVEQRIRDLKAIAPFIESSSDCPKRESLTEIGPFQITDVIARRSFCDVYRGEQAEPKREVAIKVLHLNAGGAAVERAFRSEIEILARLRHPGIAEIYLAGTSDSNGNPLLYYAMEYLSGAKLTEYAASASMEVHQRVELFLEVCRAVAHAHQNAVIHRDLKPTNILTHNGRPKILDFGISKLMRETGTVQTNFGMGTPGYISPEQFSAESIHDTRSDIFSLGVTLYELLCGKLPYAQPVTNLVEAAKAISDDDFVLLSQNLDDCPPDLEAITRKCLQLRAEDRYQSVEMLIDDLQRFLSNDEVKARPRSRLETLRYRVTKHPWISASLISASISLVLVTVVSLIYWYNASATAETLSNAVVELTDLRESDKIAREKLDAELTLRRRSALNQVLTNSDRNWQRNPGVVAGWLNDTVNAGLARDSFAWRAIKHRTKRVLDEFQAHDSPITDLSISADGTRLASASEGMLKVWQLRSRKLLMSKQMEQSRCLLHPDGEQLLVITDEELAILDAETGDFIHGMPKPQDIWLADFSSDGELILLAGSNKISVFKKDLQTELRTLTVPFANVTFARFNSDSSQLLAIGSKLQHVIVDVGSGEILSHNRGRRRIMRAFAATEDFAPIAIAEQFTRLYIGKADSDATNALLSRSERFDSLLFSPDQQWLLSMGRKRINGRSSESGWKTQWSRVCSEPVTCMQFMPKSDAFLVGQADGRIQICLVESEPIDKVLATKLVDSRTVSLSNDGKHIAVAGKEVAIYDADTNELVQSFPSSGLCADSDWNAGPLYVATSKHRDLLSFEHFADGPTVVHSSEKSIRSVATGREQVYMGLAFGEVSRLDPKEPSRVHTWQAHDSTVTALSYDPVGNMLLSGSETGEVAFWNRDHQLVSRLQIHEGAVTEFAFLRSSGRVYCSSRDGTVGVVDMQKMAALPSLRHGVDRLRTLAVSPDGQSLAIASMNNEILICDAVTGEFQTRLSGHTDIVMDLCFSPSGDSLYSVSMDGTLRCWHPNPRPTNSR